MFKNIDYLAKQSLKLFAKNEEVRLSVLLVSLVGTNYVVYVVFGVSIFI